MKIGVIGSNERGIMPFIGEIANTEVSEHSMLKFYSGMHEGIEVVSALGEAYKINSATAAQILINNFNVTHIVLIGFAGALNKQLDVGDTVISSEIAYYDAAHDVLTEYHPWMREICFRSDAKLLMLCERVAKSLSVSSRFHVGRVVTGKKFISHNERDDIIEKLSPLCVDTESANVAYACYVNSIPFIAIHSILDNENEKDSEIFKQNIKLTIYNSINLIKGLIKKVSVLER
ncbi:MULTISPECIES: 5'-methylthioadenosine/S-adenosylhomocysteine nucleosidase [unclassified Clostridium]|uniref:5'-methylthioadenosine/S-adenosylhomocysteine nucleosidase n=1 Tax=unclassified Clostridium TaxID=2614128 RepID=UPI0002982DA2|nr:MULTISPECIES: 5'-methylthioadenosine/S-adenosylhomocysteine nucleosidase [unclassified Clostridium]EKQ51581.1 MAG: 5''-methylthioadenosine/S-adenosylhomocysteine nucleosidase [Clostridium sp. Maddingley MBC34-26]